MLNSKQINEYTFKFIELLVKFNFKLKLNTMSIYDTLCVYQLQLVKAIQQTTKLQEDYKQKFNTFYSNLLDYLGSQKKAKYSQTTIIYLNITIIPIKYIF